MKNILLALLLCTGISTSFAQSWSELGTGAKALNANGTISTVAASATGDVYAGGQFTDGSGNYYVAKWSGNSWTEMSGFPPSGQIDAMVTDDTGNLYVAGAFFDIGNYSYVAKWNGSSWSKLDLDAHGEILSLAIDTKGNLYAGGLLDDIAGNMYVAKWDGSSWTELKLNMNGGIFSLATDTAGNVYAGGVFANSPSSYDVAKWDGSSWTELGLNANGNILALATDVAGNVYAAGGFVYPNATSYSVAKWNGSTWTNMAALPGPKGANGDINALATDAAGNIYATGAFADDPSTNPYAANYVAKWDGTSWSELGGTFSMPATQPISALTVNKAGIVYTGGYFGVNGSGNATVVMYGLALADSIHVSTQGNVAATITTKAGSLQLVAQIFPVAANQAVTWSVVPGTGTATISTTGLVTAQSNGTVWAKATSTASPFLMDSIQITITNEIVAIDSIHVSTQGNVAAAITTNAGSLQLVAQIFPAAASQVVTWSIVPGTGAATISATGLVTAQSNGVVWAKAVSVVDLTKKDSIQVTITNQKGMGVSNVAQAIGFKIYPNPANSQLTIETSLQSETANVSVYNVVGILVQASGMKGGKATIDVNQLPAGVYLLKYTDGTNNTQARFVKYE